MGRKKTQPLAGSPRRVTDDQIRVLKAWIPFNQLARALCGVCKQVAKWEGRAAQEQVTEMIDRKKQSMRVALSTLANIAFPAISHSRVQSRCFASSAARQFVSRQGGCPAKKLRAHELVAVRFTNPNPRSGEPIPTRPVTAKAVNDSGTTQYPSCSTEDGHGDKGGRATIHTHLSESARVYA